MKFERDDMATLNYATNLFDSANAISGDRYRRKIVKLISDEDFLMAIFNPKAGTTEKAEASSRIAQVYNAACKRSTVHAIAEALSDYGYRDMGRTSAVFLVTIVNLGMAVIDGKASDLGRAKDHHEIDGREFNKNMEKLDDYQSDLHDILKVARRIVKAKAKVLANKTGIPKELCISALFTVPGHDYLDVIKVGFYLKTVLGNLYGYTNYNYSDFEVDFDEIDWGAFFKALFGADRLPDVASLILLEGVDRIKSYENAREVRACWDSITQFALKTINRAPESIRDQMIQLYLKRINSMLADHNIDLRIDLRSLDDFKFENLAATVAKYKSKFDAIMAKAKTLANAKSETAPA